ncbi:MAG: PAS domain S-box protein [Bacteroidia bacterium]
MLAENSTGADQTKSADKPRRVSCLYSVAGWELNLETLEFTIDHQHKEMLHALGYGSTPETTNLLDYAIRYISESSQEIVQEKLQYAIENKDDPEYADRFEITMRSEDGKLYYFLVNTWLLRPGVVRGQGQNITDLKQVKNDLDYSSASLRSVIENSDDYIFTIDCGGSIQLYNENFRKVMQEFFDVEVFQGQNITTAMPTEVYDKWYPLLETACKGSKSHSEIDIQLNDLNRLDVAVNPIIANGQVTGVSFFIRNITDKWRMSAWDSLETKVLEQAYRNVEITEVFDTLLLGIQDIAPAMSCYITRKIDGKMALEWVSSPSLPASYTAHANEIPISPEFGSCGLSASSMQPAFVKDIRLHDSWKTLRDITLLNGYYSCYSMPVISKSGRVLGTLGAYYRQPHDASDFELSLWQKAVNLVGILLESELNKKENLRKANMLDEIARSIPGVLYMIKMGTDGERTFEYVSPKAREYVKVPFDSISKDYHSVIGLISKEFHEPLRETLEKSLKDKSIVEFEFTLRPDINPDFHRYKLVASHDFKEDGTVYTYGTIYDITTQKISELQLLEKQEEMGAIFRGLDDLIFVIDEECRFKDAFSNDEKKFLVPKNIMIGRKMDEFLPDHVIIAYRNACEELNQGNQSQVEFFYEMEKEGSTSYYKARVIRIVESGTYLVTVKDYTSERGIIEANNKLRYILEEASEYARFGSFEFNADTKSLLWSDQLRTMFGIPDDLTGSALFEYFIEALHPDHKNEMIAVIEDSLRNNKDFEIEHMIRHYDGKYVWLRCVARVSTDPFTKETMIRGISMDITRAKSEEREARKRQSLLEAVSLLSMKLASDEELEATVNKLLVKLGESTGVSRVYLFKNSLHPVTGDFTTTQILEWVKEGVRPQIDDEVLTDLNVGLLGFERWALLLNQGLPVVGDTKDFPGSEQAYLRDNNIKSVLVVPVALNGEWWGSLGFDECSIERVWSENEITLLSAVANLIGTVIERKRVREELIESEARLRTIVETMSEGLVIASVNGNHLSCNQAAADLVGMSKEDLLAMTPEFVYNNFINLDGTPYTEANCPAMQAMKSNKVVTGTVMGYKSEDGYRWMSVNACPLVHPITNELFGVLKTFSDVTERIRHDQELNDNLKQKELLLTEIHHRVKNNLAIVSSLLQLQQLYTTDDQVKTMLLESQGRLRSMSLVHEILYKNGDFSKVSFDKYLNEIGHYLKNTFAKPEQEILFEISTDDCNLEITKAIPCGLIVNEIVTNAFKYAFNNRAGGIIVISLRLQGEYYVLEVCDDGPGLPEGINWAEAKTMGFTLVRTLSAQLKGALSIENKNGARVVLTFPK